MIETISDFFIILYIVTHKNATKIKTFLDGIYGFIRLQKLFHSFQENLRTGIMSC